MDHATKVLSMQENEPEIQEAVEVVTTAKLITEVVAAVCETVSAAAVVQADVPAALTKTVNAAAVVTTAASVKTPTETKSKDKGKGIMIEEPKPMKKRQQVELDEAYARKLQEELNQDIDWEDRIVLNLPKISQKLDNINTRMEIRRKAGSKSSLPVHPHPPEQYHTPSPTPHVPMLLKPSWQFPSLSLANALLHESAINTLKMKFKPDFSVEKAQRVSQVPSRGSNQTHLLPIKG
nr:hypothetical protein [Tanacetum cinerariifolium]